MTAPAELPAIGFTRITLANGLGVIVRSQSHLPIVAVNVWYHVGSKDEERSRRGFAHLFEHLMFEGSEHYPGDFFKPLQRLGAAVNGSTSADRTNYFEDVPAAHLELALAMESDRMGYLLPALSEAKLRIQKDVVKNEYRQNYVDRPYGQAGRLLSEALFPPGHPYSWLTIGVMEDVEAASREEVEAFFRRYYVPSNASLALVGDLDEDRALGLAERYFGPLPGGTAALRPRTPPTGLDADVAIRLDDRVELDRIYEAWHTVRQFDPDDAPLVLLGDVLARGRSSRLYRRLVMEQGLAQGVSAHQSGRELAGTFQIVATLRPGKSWRKARETVLDDLEMIAREGITDQELKRVQNGRMAGFVYALDNIGGFGGVADRLNAYNVFLGDPGRITADFERFRTTSAEDVRRVARRYLAGCPRVALEVLGRKGLVVGHPLDRAAAPRPGPAVAFRAPRPEVRSLTGGIPLWVVPRRDLPIVAGAAVIRAGASAHGPDRGGLADLTSAMMDEGTTSRTALDLAQAAEEMGTSLSTRCGHDGSYVSFQCLTPHLGATLGLAIDVLRNPTFPEPEWARVSAQALAGLKAGRDHAESRAYRRLLKVLYGETHPYRVPVDGEEATVAGLARAEVSAFHDRFYRPDRACLVVAGDVDPDALAHLLDFLLEGWEGPAAPLPEVPDGQDNRPPRLLLLDRPGASQAVVCAGHRGLPRRHPDHAELLVFNQILGGQFTSRLNTRLREEKGFTYGVRSHFDFRRGAGPFSISASLQVDGLGEALADLKGEVAALLDGRPPTATELDDARRALIEGQARQFETPSSLVGRYAGLFLHDLPPDEYATLPDRIAAVDAHSLGRAAREHVRPEALTVVVVADAGRVAADLDRLGWGPVEREGEIETS